jgi:poly-gamma-glutamate biosynthesis protein PgsC/CapC
MVIEALFIGLLIGFLYYEAVGLSPGGVVTPGYIALFVHEPMRILSTVLLALVVWAVIEIARARLVLYGRRLLLLSLLLGFCARIVLEEFLQPGAGLSLDLQSIGYIIPGLIAHEMVRQRPFPTLASLGTVSAMVALVLMLR